MKNAILVACLFAAASTHANAAATDPARAQYDAERARCMTGTTGQDQASCLKSAGAAYNEARNGRLANPNTAYDANAATRCAALGGSERADCESRVDAGTPAGAVRAGGDVKETVTTIPAPAAIK